MNIKGQSALEFLTTYGWAFLVIILMLGTLIYFDVLSAENFLPPKPVDPNVSITTASCNQLENYYIQGVNASQYSETYQSKISNAQMERIVLIQFLKRCVNTTQ